MTKSLLTISTAVALSLAWTARPPQAAMTDVFLVTLNVNGNTSAGSAPLANISAHPEYDNQPSFTPDGEALLFTSRRDGKQTDIYRYDIGARALTQLTKTAENEYSALVMPDGKGFSVVHGAEQSLWRFDMDGSSGRLLYQHAGQIGYHVWVDATHLGAFILGSPATLQLIDLAANKAEVIEPSIGRGLLMRRESGRTQTTPVPMLFVSKAEPGRWVIKQMDSRTRAISVLTETLRGSEDYAWDGRTGAIVMGQGSKLFSWSAASPTAGWTEIADLSGQGVRNITRLAISPNTERGTHLAIVAEPVTR